VIVPIKSVLGVPIVESQYFEITILDMTPWSYPNRRNPDEQTEVIAAMSKGPLRQGCPVLENMFSVFDLILTEERKSDGRQVNKRDSIVSYW
jgi:hypothetical protein